MGQARPYATTLVLVLIGLVAWQVTGFIPTEASLDDVWFSQATLADGELHRLLTSIFAHGGILHLVFNALAILSLAGLERQLGTLRYSLVFLGSGIGGNLLHAMTSTTPTVGASGAIFGLLGVLLALAPWTRLSLFFLPVPAVVLLPAYAAVVLLVPGLSQLAPIAHMAHLGGLAAGVALALTFDASRAIEHLGYAGLAFAAVGVMILNVRAVGFDALVNAVETGGLLALISQAWPALVGLALLAGVLWALPEPQPEEG